MQFNIIYKTTNLINGKIYVGKHVQRDTSAFDGYLGSGLLIRYAIKKYGKENFLRETIEFQPTEELAFERESYWVEQLSASNKKIGYNILLGGEGVTSEFLKVMWQDPEYRKRTIESFKIGNQNSEVKERKSQIMKERWQSEGYREDQIQKLSDRWLDESYSEKTSKSLSMALNKEEYKNLRSEISKSMWKEPEFRAKTVLKMKQASTPEVRKKISDGLKGTKSPLAKYHYMLKDPNGKIWQTDCWNQFCKEHDLNPGNLGRIVQDPTRNIKGWYLISRIEKSKVGEVL